MIEFDGPPVAAFKSADGRSYAYVLYVTYHESVLELVEALAAHLKELRAQKDCFLVWRRRPVFETVDESLVGLLKKPWKEEYWKLSYRCCVLVPFNPAASLPSEHDERSDTIQRLKT